MHDRARSERVRNQLLFVDKRVTLRLVVQVYYTGLVVWLKSANRTTITLILCILHRRLLRDSHDFVGVLIVLA